MIRLDLLLHFRVAVADDAIGGHAVLHGGQAFLFSSFFHIADAVADGLGRVAVHDIAVAGRRDQVFGGFRFTAGIEGRSRPGDGLGLEGIVGDAGSIFRRS